MTRDEVNLIFKAIEHLKDPMRNMESVQKLKDAVIKVARFWKEMSSEDIATFNIDEETLRASVQFSDPQSVWFTFPAECLFYNDEKLRKAIVNDTDDLFYFVIQ